MRLMRQLLTESVLLASCGALAGVALTVLGIKVLILLIPEGMPRLRPIHIEQRYPPEAASDPATVRAISLEVRNSMEEAVAEMLRRRKSIFYGSIFQDQTIYQVAPGERLSYEKKIA